MSDSDSDDSRPDIFTEQREYARKKYASSDDEDEIDDPPNPPPGPPKPLADDDGNDGDKGPRGDDNPSGNGPGNDGPGNDQEKNNRDQAGSSASNGGVMPADGEKRKAEDQDDFLQDGGTSEDRAEALGNAPTAAEAEPSVIATPQTSDLAPLTPSTEQSGRESTDIRITEHQKTQDDVQEDSGQSKDEVDVVSPAHAATVAEPTVIATPQTSNLAPLNLFGEQPERQRTDVQTIEQAEREGTDNRTTEQPKDQEDVQKQTPKTEDETYAVSQAPIAADDAPTGVDHVPTAANQAPAAEAEPIVTTTPDTGNIAPSTPSAEQLERASTDNVTTKEPVASKIPFSFDDPAMQTLATQVHIMLLLGDCRAALKSGRTKASLGPEECNRLKHAALHAYSVAIGVKEVVGEKTMARGCIYVALTEALYSADAAQESDQRALGWFRRAFAYRGTKEADLAQLWIKALEAHERARKVKDHQTRASQDTPLVLPNSPESPLSKTQTWLSGVASRPVSSADDGQRPESARTVTSRPTGLAGLSDPVVTLSNRDLILRGGPVGVRELSSQSEV